MTDSGALCPRSSLRSVRLPLDRCCRPARETEQAPGEDLRMPASAVRASSSSRSRLASAVSLGFLAPGGGFLGACHSVKLPF
jgi:hypothetical protein